MDNVHFYIELWDYQNLKRDIPIKILRVTFVQKDESKRHPVISDRRCRIFRWTMNGSNDDHGDILSREKPCIRWRSHY